MTSGIMDLSFLTEEERRQIVDVLRKDEKLRKDEDRRARKLRQELQTLRKKGAIKADSDNSGKRCARCQEPLGWIFNAGDLCPKCQHKVCKTCQVLQTSGKKKWLCVVCNKTREIKARTGDWFYEKIPQVNNVKLVGSDLVRASMHKDVPSRDSSRHRRHPNAIKHSPQRSPYRHRRQLSGETVTDSIPSPHGSPSRRQRMPSPQRVSHEELRDSDSSSQYEASSRFDGDSLESEKRQYPSVPEEDQFPESQRRYEHYRVNELKRRSSSDSEPGSSPQVSVRSSVWSSPPIYNNDGMDTPTTMSENPSEADDRLKDGYAFTDSQSEPGVDWSRTSDTPSVTSSANNNYIGRETGDGADSEKDKLSGHIASDLSDSEPEIVTEVLSGVGFQRMAIKCMKQPKSPGNIRRSLEVVEENGTGERYNTGGSSPKHKGSVDSLTSFYSSAGERNLGKIKVTGDIKFGLSYNYKTGIFEVKIVACRDLAPVDARRNTSDPYAKSYLLPDKTKNGKRKTRIKKHTLNPAFDETLKYVISESELQTRTLWISIWHNDAFGHNDFLGEVQLPLDDVSLENFHPEWRPLCPRVNAAGVENSLAYKGDLSIGLKYTPGDASNGSPSREALKAPSKPKKKSKNPSDSGKGAIHINIKEARNLIAVRINGYSDPFAKCYLLPNKSKAGKRKTEVIKKNCNPNWDQTFVYEGISVDDLKERSLEVTLWDRESMASNDFLGGLRLGVGSGKSYGKDVKWQDSTSGEVLLWQRMVDNQNQWVEANLMLRTHMNGKEAKEPEFNF